MSTHRKFQLFTKVKHVYKSWKCLHDWVEKKLSKSSLSQGVICYIIEDIKNLFLSSLCCFKTKSPKKKCILGVCPNGISLLKLFILNFMVIQELFLPALIKSFIKENFKTQNKSVAKLPWIFKITCKAEKECKTR